MSYRNERLRERLDARLRRKTDAHLVEYEPGAASDFGDVGDETAAGHRVIDQTDDQLMSFAVIGVMHT